MKTLTRKTKYKSSEAFRLYFLTDTHLGARACDEKLLKRDIQRIADDPLAFWIGGGDMVDGISSKDPRYDAATHATWLHGVDEIPQTEAEYAADFFRPIAPKCLALLTGNHERSVRKHSKFNPYRFIVRELISAGAPDDVALGFGGFIHWRFGRGKTSGGGGWTLTIFAHHGAGSAGVGLPGGYALKLGRMLDNAPYAQLVLAGHLHVKAFVEKVAFQPRLTKAAEQVARKAVFVPGYLRRSIEDDKAQIPPTTYVEEKLYPAGAIGTFPIVIRPRQHKVEIVL